MIHRPSDNKPDPAETAQAGSPSIRVLPRVLRRAIWLTHLGLICETLWRALWPLFSVVMAGLAFVFLGGLSSGSTFVVWASVTVAAFATVAALAYARPRFFWPRQTDALARVDASLPGQPLAALRDEQATGTNDPATVALWQAHRARMERRAAAATPQAPDLSLTARDPYALRFVAAVALTVAVLFGSFWHARDLVELTRGGGGQGLSGPTWEGWVEPPRHTGLPALYLNDQPAGALSVPENSRITLRFYGEIGALQLSQTLSVAEDADPSAPEQAFTVLQGGVLQIVGPNGRDWQVSLIEDNAPQIRPEGSSEGAADGSLTLPFTAEDDYGVTGGYIRIDLDLASIDRRYGLEVAPEPRAALELPLPLTLTGDRREFTEALIDDFSEHPWANLPVRFTFVAEDAAGQLSDPTELQIPLGARRFFDPVAAALIEQRRDLLWNRENGRRIGQVLRTLGHYPADLFGQAGHYLQLRAILFKLESGLEDGLDTATQEQLAEALWTLALQFEEGEVGDALERMRQAQERLSQAMRDGASDEEIARLMQELRDATQDYMRQLSRQAAEEAEDLEPGEQGGDSVTLSQSDLQAMMDRIQELMEQGRMAEAEQALREFQQMMENMRVTQGQGGQGNNPGQQAMEGLADTLRDQQDLSDEAFRDLQQQFNPQGQPNGQQPGQQQGQQGQQGQNGQGQNGEGQQRGTQQGQGTGPGDLARRQQALRNQLRNQQGNMPLAGPEGEALGEALDRAGRAMEGAEQALRDGEFGDAIDQQSEAMEALRDGMRALGEALADQQQNQPGGQQDGNSGRMGNALDPLGRSRNGQFGDYLGDDMINGGELRRRAWDLLEELRRRAGERDRSEQERDYLKRLLDNF